MNKNTIVGFFIKTLVFTFCLFLVFAPFSTLIVKTLFYTGLVLWLCINTITLKSNFLKGLFPHTLVSKQIFFFAFACIFSILFSFDPNHSQGIFFERYLMYFFLFFMGAGIIVTYKKSSVILSGVFIVWNFIFALGAFFDHIYFVYVKPNSEIAERIWSIFGTQIPYYGFPLYLTFFIPFNIFLLLISKNKWLQRAAGLNCILLFFCLLWNASRIAWAGVVISLILIFALRYKKAVLIGVGIFAVMLSASFFYPKSLTRLKTIPTPSEWSNRMPLYKSAIAIFKDHPVFGSGIGMFEKVLHYPKYELPDDYPVPKKLNLHAHNTYLEVASEMGVVGLSAFLSIFIVFFWNAVKLLRNPVTVSNNDLAIFAGLSASTLAILIFAFGSTIITVGPTVSGYFWFLFGLANGFLVKNKQTQ